MTSERFLGRTEPLIIGHRGVSSHALENTIAAFAMAVDNFSTQCDAIELDFHTTSDGVFVVHHDPVLPSGEVIAETSAAELLGIPLANGAPMPTLAEVLNFSEELDLFLEAKGLPPESDGTLLRLLSEAPDSSRIHVHAFDHRVVARLSQASPQGSYGVLSASYPIDPVGAVLAAGAKTLWQESSLIDFDLVNRCLAAEIGVIAWTVNNAREANRLRELGVAGLCGNWPERLRG